MRRRGLVALCGLAAFAPRALAQSARTYRVGFLSPGVEITESNPQGAAFHKGLAEQGYRLGANLIIERRGAMGRTADLPRLAGELVAVGVEALVTIGYPPALAAKATGLPTIAASGVGDPVATGLVESLARPGGNVTGISDNAAELSAKRLGLLKELLPGL